VAKYNRKLTADARRALFGDELIRLTAAYVANPTAQTLGDYNAALIGRCASQAAAAVLPLYERIEGIKVELADLWLTIDATQATLEPPAHKAHHGTE
jgi:hypothetical protein